MWTDGAGSTHVCLRIEAGATSAGGRVTVDALASPVSVCLSLDTVRHRVTVNRPDTSPMAVALDT